MAEIVNRIANSPIVTFKLEDHYPEGERMLLDIKEVLFHGMILREKDFRQWIKDHDWSQYQDKHVAVFCSADAIVQSWAWMLLMSVLQPVAATVVMGDEEQLEKELWRRELEQVDWAAMADRPVVVKGCSDRPVPSAIYAEATKYLLPFAKKISFGEPCSTVPVWKKG
ncbi:MAG: DUF2480 family protein [Bacteroidia bacterium]|nr:DUF2480 family protein [Bacteroidia bacterium]